MRRYLVVALGVLAVTVACSPPSEGNSDIELYLDGGFGPPGAMDMDNDGGQVVVNSTYPAFLPDVPQVQNLGGPVLQNPVIVPIFFANDDSGSVSTLTDFDNRIGQTSYWTAAVSEYGVGPATAVSPYMSSDRPNGTLSDAQVQSWLLSKIANDSSLSSPTPNTIYVLHYPSQVTVSLPDGQGGTLLSCQEIGGYHSQVALSGGDQSYVAYAVVPRCAEFNGLQGLAGTTAAESHELAEGATDPQPGVNSAYGAVDEAHLVWELLFGSEVGDLCVQDPQSYLQPDGFPYTVQRIWSNLSASQGHDPCVPMLPNEVYFNSVPKLSDMASLSLDSSDYPVESFNVSKGSSGTTSLSLYSDGPMNGPWSVQVVDMGLAQGGSASAVFALDNSQGLNGDTLQLEVSAIGSPPLGDVDVFYVISSAADGTTHYWVGAIGEL